MIELTIRDERSPQTVTVMVMESMLRDPPVLAAYMERLLMQLEALKTLDGSGQQ